MRRALRLVLLVMIALLLVALVVAFAGDTGAAEKVAIAGMAALLLVAAAQVQRRLA